MNRSEDECLDLNDIPPVEPGSAAQPKTPESGGMQVNDTYDINLGDDDYELMLNIN